MELAALDKLGVDGVFTDNTPTGGNKQFFSEDPSQYQKKKKYAVSVRL